MFVVQEIKHSAVIQGTIARRSKKMKSLVFMLVCWSVTTAVAADANTSFILSLVGADLAIGPPVGFDPNGERFPVGPRHYFIKMSLLPGSVEESAQEVVPQEVNFFVDTGSGVTVQYTVDTSNSEECDDLFEGKNALNLTIPDLRQVNNTFTPATRGSNACKEVDYTVSNSKDSNCPFEIAYAGGENIQGYVVDNAYVYADGSRQILGASTTMNSRLGNVLTTLNGGVTPLYAPFYFGRIDSALSCIIYPGIVGMDSTPSAFAPQLASDGTIGSVVFSMCVSSEGLYSQGEEAGFLIMGPAVPSTIAPTLGNFPLYNGKTLQRIKTENKEFQEDIASLNVRGLDTHFFVITDGVTIGDETFQGPLDTLIDSGYSGVAFESSIIDSLNENIAANAASKGYTVEQECFLVGAVTSDEAVTIANDIAPSIQVSLSDTVTYSIDGTSYMNVEEAGSGEYRICNTASVSEKSEPAILGTSFFINRFVQFDWGNQVLRVADVTSCPSSTSNDTYTAEFAGAEMSGNYSFPYSIESGSHPQDGVMLYLVAAVALLFMMDFF